MLTHKPWVNAGWYRVLFRAPPPANPARIPTGVMAGRVGHNAGWYQAAASAGTRAIRITSAEASRQATPLATKAGT
jgi:hypothetical protein